VWAIATPFVLRSARWFPVVGNDRRISARSFAAHIAIGSLFIVVSNLLIRLPIALAEAQGLDALVRSTMQGVAEYYPPALVVYGVIVAIGHYVFRRLPADDGSLGDTVAGASMAEIVTDLPVVADADRASAKSEAVNDAAVAVIEGHLTVRQWNRVHLVRVEDIDFVEAEDNYVVVHAASRTFKGRDRISDVESQLDSRQFVRIHRSTIVHIAKIREVQPLSHGDHAVILRSGKVLRVARSRRQALQQALGVEL
jgi:two-component system LytT family response regulator